jgi:hypothetical protein
MRALISTEPRCRFLPGREERRVIGKVQAATNRGGFPGHTHARARTHTHTNPYKGIYGSNFFLSLPLVADARKIGRVVRGDRT